MLLLLNHEEKPYQSVLKWVKHWSCGNLGKALKIQSLNCLIEDVNNVNSNFQSAGGSMARIEIAER